MVAGAKSSRLIDTKERETHYSKWVAGAKSSCPGTQNREPFARTSQLLETDG